MKVLVTGGGGFLGRYIVEALLKRRDEVRVLGRRPYPDLVTLGAETVQGDLADEQCVQRACAGMDAVVHTGALAGIWGPFSRYYRTNVVGTENVLAACRAHGIGRLVYTSTPSVVYGRQAIEGGDESLPYPASYLTYYAQTKATAEREVLAAHQDDVLHTCALRPHLIWGPRDTNLIPRLVARAQAGRLRRIGAGENRISVSYVENVADAHLAALDALASSSPCGGKAYFINEDEPVNCWQFIDRLLAAAGAPAVPGGVPLWLAYAGGAVCEALYAAFASHHEPPMTRFVALQLATSHWFRIDAARRDLGWEPRVSIEDGLACLQAACSHTH